MFQINTNHNNPQVQVQPEPQAEPEQQAPKQPPQNEPGPEPQPEPEPVVLSPPQNEVSDQNVSGMNVIDELIDKVYNETIAKQTQDVNVENVFDKTISVSSSSTDSESTHSDVDRNDQGKKHVDDAKVQVPAKMD